MLRSEPEVTAEWGPPLMNRLGKPSTARDIYASAPVDVAQRSLKARPSRPKTRNGYWNEVSKPVAQIRTSSSCDCPLRSSTVPVGVIRAISIVSSLVCANGGQLTKASTGARGGGGGGGTHWSGKRKGEDGNLKETDVVRAQSFKVAHAGREPATRDAPGRDDCFGGGVVSGRI
jgi:hypothetical protein